MAEAGLMLGFDGCIKLGLEKNSDSLPQWEETGKAYAKEDTNNPGLLGNDTYKTHAAK